MFAYYRQLIHLRKTIPALRNTSRENMTARQMDDRNVLYLVRKFDDQLLVSFLNFESAEVKVTLPEISDSRLKLLLNSADTTWGGPGHRPPAFSEIPPQSITIWTIKKA
jgi:maltooligosyltrehalose trehalohydrolase